MYGKAEGTARMKALRWDTREPNKASALREGRRGKRRREWGPNRTKRGLWFLLCMRWEAIWRVSSRERPWAELSKGCKDQPDRPEGLAKRLVRRLSK